MARRFKLPLALMPLLLIPVREGHCAALLSIQDISQSVGASYLVSRTSSAGESLTQQESQEDYSASFSYHILDPRLVRGSALLSLDWQQRDYGPDNESSTYGMRYSVYSQILPRHPYPISVSASSTKETISQAFTPSYTNETDTFSTQLSLQNEFIPSYIQLFKQSNQSSGLPVNVRQQSDSLTVNATPNLKEYGSLSLGVSLAESETATDRLDLSSNSSTASVNAGYGLGWRSVRGLGRRFALNYGYQQSYSDIRQENYHMSSSLGGELGKALNGNLGYLQSRNSSTESWTETRSAHGVLRHRLMGSLGTTLQASATEMDFAEGTDRSYQGTVGWDYSKFLPEGGAVSGGYSFGKVLNQRMGDAAEVPVLEEEYPVPVTFPRRIRLRHDTFIAETVAVTGGQTLLPYPASAFTVLADGIELQDVFPGDTTVVISYSYRQDPSVTTLSTSHSIGVVVTLLSGKYRYYGNVRMSDQELVKGRASGLSMTDTLHYDLGTAMKLGPHGVGGEFGYDKSYAIDSYYLNTSWSNSRRFWGGDLDVSAGDNISWGETRGRRNPWLNSFTLQSSYLHKYKFGGARLRGNYANVMREGGSPFHIMSMAANLEGKYGKFSALLSATANYSISPRGNSLSESVGVSIRRSF